MVFYIVYIVAALCLSFFAGFQLAAAFYAAAEDRKEAEANKLPKGALPGCADDR